MAKAKREAKAFDKIPNIGKGKSEKGATVKLPPRPLDGSRKATVFDTYFADGYDAAMKKAAGLDLKDGTARSWMSGWAKSAGLTLPPSGKAKAKGPRKERAPREKIVREKKPRERIADPNNPFPEFPHFETERKARIWADHRANSTGMDKRVFVPTDIEGKWFVVPIHLAKGVPIPTFKEGDHVTNLGVKNSRAIVIGAGPEQSVIRYIKDVPGRHREPCIANRYLLAMEAPKPEGKKKGKASRERL